MRCRTACSVTLPNDAPLHGARAHRSRRRSVTTIVMCIYAILAVEFFGKFGAEKCDGASALGGFEEGPGVKGTQLSVIFGASSFFLQHPGFPNFILNPQPV